jgi:hypothetical protein
MSSDRPPDVYTITNAQRGLSAEQAGRQRRYLVSMSIRTACVILAILVPGWPRVAFIVGAIVLPYLSVVVANAGRENDEPGHVPVVQASGQRELPSADGRSLPS